jgi:hypothetical protein
MCDFVEDLEEDGEKFDSKVGLQKLNKSATHVHGPFYLSFDTERSSIMQFKRIGEGNQNFTPICMTRFGEELDPANHEHLPISLADIYSFYDMLQTTRLAKPHSNILLCTGPSPYTQFGTLFLLGSYLILSGVELSEAINSLLDFEYVTSTFKCHGLSALDFWCSLYRSRQMGWLNFEATDEMSPISTLIDIEEYIHYSR